MQGKTGIQEVHFDYGVRHPPAWAWVCVVPGCTRPPDGPLPVCDHHRFCPRCGQRIHVFGRVALDCCGLCVPVMRRRAWVIPWLLMLKSVQLHEGPRHRIRLARVLVGRLVVARSLPWLEEK